MFLVPGMVAMSVLFTLVFSGIQIIWDKQFGFLKETLIAPVSRLEIMFGQTVGGATTAVIQGVILMVLAVLLGMRINNPIGFLIALGFMVLVGISFTAFGIAIASRMEDMTGFQLDHELCRLPALRALGRTFSHQFPSRVARSDHPARPAHVRGGRHPVRPDRGFADQPDHKRCGDSRVCSRDDGDWGIPVQESYSVNENDGSE